MPALDLKTEGFATENFRDNLDKINEIEQDLE